MKKNRTQTPASPRFPLAAGIFACILLLVAIIFASKSGRGTAALRKAASQEITNVEAAHEPAQITNIGNGSFIWSLRSAASHTVLNPVFAEAAQFINDAPRLAKAELDKRENDAGRKTSFAPLLAQDGATPPRLLASAAKGPGESLDAAGMPLRWLLPGNILSAYSKPRAVVFKMPPKPAYEAQFDRAFAKLRPAGNASAYRTMVESHTRKYNLNPDLVMAIIHSESHFQPGLVSPRSAMGLMQLLPSTASGEVHSFLYGKRGQVSYEQLAVPEINVNYGTAYLHILFSRYFANVRDPGVREACVIASYNLGPNRFLKLYGASNDAAVANINSMDPEDFHADLPRRLPVRETRYYVEKVKRMKAKYSGANP